MNALRLTCFLLIASGLLFFTSCDNNVSSNLEESFELYTDLEPIQGASNASATINRYENVGGDSWFQVDLSNIGANNLLGNGKVGAWCIEWKKPLRSENDLHEGLKLYSTNGSSKWKPLGYFFSIKNDLQIEDPSLTVREMQAVIWSLAGYMKVAPKFDVQTLADNELPSRLLKDGKANFNRDKVTAIVNRVKREYQTAKFRLKNANKDMIVVQTKDDEQDVVVPPVEDPGKDVVVFNDINPFDETGMANPNNVLLVQNLVDFVTDGPRDAGTVVWMDRGRNSRCAAGTGNGECSDTGWATMRSTISGTGMTLVDNNTSGGSMTSIPAEVKVIIFATPRVAFTVDEINAMKAFADEGGRIVFVGEHQAYYGVGIDVENQFLINMGAVLRNTGASLECGRRLLPGTSIIEHPITDGLTEFAYACFSNIDPGPEDFILMLGQNEDLNMAGVAEIDTEPITELSKVVSVVQSKFKDDENLAPYAYRKN